MKKTALLPLAASIILVSVFVYLNPFILQYIQILKCTSGDANCIKEAKSMKENCIPSSTVIEGRDGIVLMVNITREGGRCIRTETVINSTDPDSNYLVGHNVTCESELSRLDEPESLVCPGSLYDYVVPSGDDEEGGASGGGYVPPQGIPQIVCGIEDDSCKNQASQYVQGCINSKTITTDIIYYPSGYWTLLMNITRADECVLYFEVLNAVDIPPANPSTLLGLNMTCSVPLSEFPLESLKPEWCAGDLFDYIQLIET
jgi:hypothetical protein